MIKRIFLLSLLSLSLTGISAQKISHPGLIFTPNKIQLAKQRIKDDPKMASAWKEIQQKADELLSKNDLMKSDYLSLAYLMTGEQKYANKTKEILLNAVKASSWADAEMIAREPAWNSELQIAHRSFACAVSFDAIYNSLSPSERNEIATGLERLAIKPALGDWMLGSTRIHSLNSMGHNWWSSCVNMGGLLALSLQNELPKANEWVENVNEIMPEWFSFAGDVLQQKPKSFDENGGMYESVNYANFGIQEALLFRLAWINTHPGQKPIDIPQLAKLPDFFLNICYPRTGMLYSINFGDSHRNITAEGSLQLLYSLGIGEKNSLWYFNQVVDGQNRDGFFRNTPMGFLYLPETNNAPAAPQLPTSQLYSDFGWATIRDSWKKDATMLAVKSGFTWNHSHADANSFILFHKGVDIIKDAGNCGYATPEYRNYFFQSRAHNVVLFNGEGQPTEQQYRGSSLRGSLSNLLDGGNVKYVLANGTGPYSNNFSRNFRHFLWIDNVIYMIDDLKTYKSGKFEWLWHTGGDTKKNGIDVNVTNGNSSVIIRPLYPEILAKSEFIHDYPNDLFMEAIKAPTEELKDTETYYSFHLPAEVNSVKGLTAIILKDSANDTSIPKMERIQGKNWIGLRVKNKGKVTDIYINQLADGRLMHMNSWINADGWETDGYLFAVSYTEGTNPASATDIFMAYGSALRRNETTYFSSLSKLFFIQKQENKKIELQIDGQPMVNAIFHSNLKPNQVIVNGKPTVVKYNESQLTVKY
jgi:oligo-alginate lyase